MRRALLAAVVVAVIAASATAAAASAADPIPGTWGGTVTATDGEAVTVDIANQIPQDPALQLQWADYLTTLVHGPELQTVTVVLLGLRQVQGICGRSALACYLGDQQTLYAPVEDVAADPSAKSIVAHEYGHHVADSRNNAPWPAIDWGTKRWATAMGVCSRVDERQLYPGDEGRNYLFNPGEAFAESYRVLNEQLLGLPATPWTVVDNSLQPSQAALDALKLDITSPWTGPTILTRKGAFAQYSKLTQKTFSIPTPLDGSLAVRVSSPPGAAYKASASTKTVCGQRSVTVTVNRIRGYGPFTLTVSTP
jgi:hypothetical protein